MQMPESNSTITSQPLSIHGMEEFANWRRSVMALHKCIFFLITVLGFCLQLKFTTASPYVLDYRNTVLMRLFIIDISVYCGSFGVMILQTNHSSTDFGEFMNNISLLLGTLASILELLILFPPFGCVTLFFWSISFVTLAIKSYQYLKTLCKNAVAGLDRVYEKLKQLLIKRRRDSVEQETKDQSKERYHVKLKPAIATNLYV